MLMTAVTRCEFSWIDFWGNMEFSVFEWNGFSGTSASIFRDIKIGDHITDVFKKIPARDTELKKWAIQGIYGYEKDDPKGYADLQFIALSYYQLMIITKDTTTKIIFSRVGTNVKWVEISHNYENMPFPDTGTIK